MNDGSPWPALAATVAMAAAVRSFATTPVALRPPTPTDSPMAVSPVAAAMTGALVAAAPTPATPPRMIGGDGCLRNR